MKLPVYYNKTIIGYATNSSFSDFEIVNPSLWKEMISKLENPLFVSSRGKVLVENLESENEVASVFEIIPRENSNFDLSEYSTVRKSKKKWLKNYKKLSIESKDLEKLNTTTFYKTMKYELPLYKKLIIKIKTTWNFIVTKYLT